MSPLMRRCKQNFASKAVTSTAAPLKSAEFKMFCTSESPTKAGGISPLKSLGVSETSMLLLNSGKGKDLTLIGFLMSWEASRVVYATANPPLVDHANP